MMCDSGLSISLSALLLLSHMKRSWRTCGIIEVEYRALKRAVIEIYFQKNNFYMNYFFNFISKVLKCFNNNVQSITLHPQEWKKKFMVGDHGMVVGASYVGLIRYFSLFSLYPKNKQIK